MTHEERVWHIKRIKKELEEKAEAEKRQTQQMRR